MIKKGAQNLEIPGSPFGRPGMTECYVSDAAFTHTVVWRKRGKMVSSCPAI